MFIGFLSIISNNVFMSFIFMLGLLSLGFFLSYVVDYKFLRILAVIGFVIVILLLLRELGSF